MLPEWVYQKCPEISAIHREAAMARQAQLTKPTGALGRLEQNQDISILITDINMPGMDGHELAELAKRVRPELKMLQLSGREPRRGGLPMIRKPFSFEELADVMQRTAGIR